MEWTGLNDLRERFLRFYESKGHLRLPSFPLLPQDDGSLLLINSGMAPLKKYFLGLETPPNKRVTTCQKCIRTPDIERVGKTSRHGTYFEMLGNFSFGDYFKNEATAWAWEFITEDLKLPLDRIWVSIYQDDDEAFDIWTKKVGVDPNKIVRLGKADNFWEIGAGPCGPCSEIYFDRGEQYGCDNPDCAVGCDCDRYVEFWNLVFTQFNSDGADNYTPLEHPNIDTGMGLERLACIMQGVGNLFEVDTVQNIMKHICDIAGVTYKTDDKTDVSLRVITDHIRSTTFMVGDGILPQNEGRGYVLRRLLRRAARHGRLLGIKKPFLFEVCQTVIKENESAYPDMIKNKDYITKIIRIEEERFAKTIDQGMDLLTGIIEKIEAQSVQEGKNRTMPGEQAFKLYDTYGFPLDLIQEIVEERKISLDVEEFTYFMNEQRKRARDARAQMGDVSWEENVLIGIAEKGSFVGYNSMTNEAKVVALVRDNELVEMLSEGDDGVVVLDRTPFYAESGGQTGDQGVIANGNYAFQVVDCKKSATGHFMHIGVMQTGAIAVGDTVEAMVAPLRRQATMRNHTACHLLQAALRIVLGDHVHQAGSMVDENVCRFDFSHFDAMTAKEIKEVEMRVNHLILSGLDVNVTEMPIDQAKEQGAMALFGEKYGNTVRVCNIGGKSIELCGGTHIGNTAKIGLFKIVKESSVAAGVRRIEAVTGEGVLKFIEDRETLLAQASTALKLNNPLELPIKAVAVTAELKQKDKEIAELTQKMADMQFAGLFENAQEVQGIKIISAGFTGTKPEAVRAIADRLKDRRSDVVGVITSIFDGKGTINVVCGKDAVAKGLHAGKLIKEITAICGGSGGGRPENAMGGVNDLFKLDEAIAALYPFIQKQLEA